MEQKVIKVDGIWKQYKLGDINVGSLKEEAHHWWNKHVLGKVNENYSLTEPENDLSDTHGPQTFWALKDINFEVVQGEALGIIGKNGAGKSTLLKILSRVTRPTRGFVKGYGHIASMLEVGTGFHNELTGRENIFLNGNILGMSNREIKQKFDAIVDFSGIAKFIDTPVKRYSSGMYVRLAFSVAAHLEPDILIVDEVLSVGDSEFQDKCMTKMQEIAFSRGCTIIYVSHNMSAILQLCNRAVLLKQGQLVKIGSPRKVVDTYFSLLGKRNFYQSWEKSSEVPGNNIIRIKEVRLEPVFLPGEFSIDVRTPINVHFEFKNFSREINLSVGIHLFTNTGECIFDVPSSPALLKEGDYKGVCSIPGHFLNDGEYYISLIFVKDTDTLLYYLERCLSFEVADYRGNIKWKGKWAGKVRPDFPVKIIQKRI